MNIHEYQGKDILRKFGVAVPRGIVAYSPDEAKQAAEQLFEELGCPVVVVKAQIHAGGRGKAGFYINIIKSGCIFNRDIKTI